MHTLACLLVAFVALTAPAAAFGRLRATLELPDDEWFALWSSRRIAPRVSSTDTEAVTFNNSVLAGLSGDSHSWRSRATRVKNQGACGSCWVFSVLAALEIVRGPPLTALSEQSALDCIQGPGLSGCLGGNPFDFAAALTSQGLAHESDYEYASFINATGFACQNVPRNVLIRGIQEPTQLPGQDAEDVMAAYVKYFGPLQVSIDASTAALRTYRGGVLLVNATGAPYELNHGVAILGFGLDGAVPYWLVKNSWGPQWGEGGYFRLQRYTNALGIAQQPLGIAT